jgi:O-antigen biosynthesis protein
MIRAGYFMREPRVFHSPRLIRYPQVSIVLPTFCRGDNGLLERSINSVLSQTFSSFELIVMDDGSIDATADLLSAYVRSDDRVIHVRHDTNCGLPALRVNEALLMARGELCAYQFDDDQWTNTLLATMAGALQKNPGFGVVYGRCRCFTSDGDQLIWGGPFNYQQLMMGNFIANNSVMHRRRVFERLGGYDMHVVMRRLCDWDLWLRWGRSAPFLFVDEVVSMVEARRPESIGKTCVADRFAIRSHMAFDRDARLRPDTLKSYVVDDLDHLRHLGSRKVESIWRQQVAPYLSRFRHIWTAVRPPNPKPLHVLVSKGRYASTFDITIGNFAEALAGDFVFTFVPESQTNDAAIRCADILLLHRTTDEDAGQLAEIARRHGKAVVYLMDDDLISLHEVAEDFSWLAPGAPRRLALESVIRGSDLVIIYSPLMQESVQELNPRNVLLETNIRRKWLANAKSSLNQPAGASEAEVPVRIGFAGGATHREELAVLWPAIVEASRHLGARAEFHFWGFTPDGVEQLQSPYHSKPFTFSYEEYLSCLTSGGFHVMIAPLFAEKRAKRAKCPIKFLEITAAGAVGVYSDVEPYRAVVDGVSGIKCENTVESWSAAILKAASLLPAGRKRLIAQAIQTIERDYTSETQAPRVAATLEAAVLHSQLNRAGDGKPRIAYFCHSPYLSGAGNRLLGYASLAQAFQFEPVLVLPSGVGTSTEVMQRRATDLGIAIAYLPLKVETEMDVSRQLDESTAAEIRRWLSQNRIGLVHSFNLMREVGEAARVQGTPHVASLFETYSRDPARVHHCDVVHSDTLMYADCWGEVLNAPARRILSYVPDRYFDVGDSASAGGPPAQDGRPIIGLFGSVQPRKGQLQAVEAIGLLKKQFDASVQLRLFGYDHFDPTYLAACKEMAERYSVSNLVSFSGFATDTAAEMRGIDVVLCASDRGSIPQAIPEAMAAGRLVIAPYAGGIADVVSQGTGIPMPDNTAPSIVQALAKVLALTEGEWRDKTNLAREVARQECSKYPVATELFRLYREASAGHTQAPERPGTIARQDPEKVPELAAANGKGAGWSRYAAKLRIFSKT